MLRRRRANLRVIAFTDGACSGNPGPGGWAATINHEEGHEIISGHEMLTTNNRMELMAVFMAIQHAKKKGYSYILVNSDSAYVVNSITLGWLQKWKRNGWKAKNGESIKNIDLWKQMNVLLSDAECEVQMKKVKGHSGNTFNELADEYARREVEKAKRKQEA